MAESPGLFWVCETFFFFSHIAHYVGIYGDATLLPICAVQILLCLSLFTVAQGVVKHLRDNSHFFWWKIQKAR